MLRAGRMRELAGGTDHVGKDRVDSGEPAFEGRELGGRTDRSSSIHARSVICKVKFADAAASAAFSDVAAGLDYFWQFTHQ